jgi:hypothetical protein
MGVFEVYVASHAGLRGTQYFARVPAWIANVLGLNRRSRAHVRHLQERLEAQHFALAWDNCAHLRAARNFVNGIASGQDASELIH